MNDMVQLIMNNGMGVVLMAYFLYKDWKFNETITSTLSEINKTLAQLNIWHTKEAANDGNV